MGIARLEEDGGLEYVLENGGLIQNSYQILGYAKDYKKAHQENRVFTQLKAQEDLK